MFAVTVSVSLWQMTAVNCIRREMFCAHHMLIHISWKKFFYVNSIFMFFIDEQRQRENEAVVCALQTVVQPRINECFHRRFRQFIKVVHP
jgi:hypothetical protein